MANSPNEQRLTSGQKVGFSFMLVFAFLAVGLGMLQMRSTIYGPFVNSTADRAQAVDDAQLIFDEAIRAQRIDTDQDGLNDFEELNFYQTSPYLPDTDSDGISDKKELDEGSDPLCPEGQDCGLGASPQQFSTSQDTDGSSPLLDQALEGSGSVLGINSPADGAPAPFDIGGMLQDPAQLRAGLLASGQVTEGELNSITDDELLDLAQRAIQPGVPDTGTSQPQSGAGESEISTADLEALLEKPAELRELLVSTGKMTKEQLDQIDDATLITATKELIASQQT